ncbi:MAG: alpha/beta fold hydrolase [Planctomycetaceae bacterium]|nr:alpha/beta fold hydrolase [Planctomycetaceae bacterium]
MNRLFCKLAVLLLASGLALTVHADDSLPRRAVLGLRLARVPSTLANELELMPDMGAVASEILPDKSAANAGVREGDILLALNGKAIAFGNIAAQANELRAGEKFTLTVSREREQLELTGIAVEKSRDPGNNNYEVIYSHVMSNGQRMRTIITRPRKEGKFPGFMFIQGFSPVSYDFVLEGSKGDVNSLNGPLLYEFANSDFVTIRVEKPGVGDSEGGPFAELDYLTELDIYRQTLKQLKEREDVDTNNIFIFGHSMGGAFGPMIAAESQVRGIAVYGAAARTWYEYLLDTLRYQGLVAGDSYENTDERVRAGSKVLAMVFLENKTIDEVLTSYPELAPLTQALFPNGMFNGKSLEFWRQLGRENMPAYWSRCKAHVLAVRGASDYVTYQVDHQLIADIVNRAKPGTGRSLTLPESDHLFFKHATEQASLQSGQKGEYNLEFARLMKSWIKEVMDEKNTPAKDSR